MAPLFEERGVAAAYGCAFKITAIDDGKIYMYLYAAAETFVVSARCKGLVKAQFEAFKLELERPGENAGANSIGNPQHRILFFDDAFEKAFGHRPARKAGALPATAESGASNPIHAKG